MNFKIIAKLNNPEAYSSQPTIGLASMKKEYSSVTKTIADSHKRSIQIMKHVTERLKKEKERGSTINILDLATADGVNSQPVFTSVIQALDGYKVSITYNDQAFSNKEKLKKVMASFNTMKVKTSTVQKNYLLPLAEDSSIDVFYCAYSTHWSDFARAIDVLENIRVQGDTVPEETLAEYKEKAHQEFVDFLKLRKTELRPGGELVMLNLLPETSKIFYETLNTLIIGLVEKGLITKKTAEAFVFPVYFRSEEENIKAANEVGFEVVSTKTNETPCHIYAEYSNSKSAHVGNKERYSEFITNYLFSWAETTLYKNMEKSGEHESTIKLAIQSIKDQYKQKAKEDPKKYSNPVPIHYLVLKNKP